MKRGMWHQMGYNSQKLIIEQLQHQNGVGVIISPRYLSFDSANEYASKYAEFGPDIIYDPEFYVPESDQGKLGTYPSASLRASVSALKAISETDLDKLSRTLEGENRNTLATALIAPAVPYEASRRDLEQLNEQLFLAAKRAGDAIGIPTFATVVISRSATTPTVVTDLLSAPTSLNADGWYFQFEFEDSRLPTDENEVFRFCVAALTLACTDKPVLHACAGPMSILSFGVGATGSAVTFRQNLWGFDRTKWFVTDGQGGGGNAPARFFSSALWGTIVQPDETVLLAEPIRKLVLTHSPFSSAVVSAPTLPWSKWDANKHMVYILAQGTNPIANLPSSRSAADAASDKLARAIRMHRQIESQGIQLKDDTNLYQTPWRNALQRAIKDCADDYQWLSDLGR
jgi:hypothetical protein